MLKVYEKPKLVALSVSGNDVLCAACTIDVVGNNADPDFKQTIEAWKQMGMTPLTEDGACKDPISGYCKFTSGSIIYNS